MVGGTYHGPRLRFQQHAVPRIDAQEDLGSLGYRLRGDAAEDEPPSVPIEMVLGEVALKDAAPHTRGPDVAPRAGTLPRELEVHGARGEDGLAPRLPPVGHAVHEGAARRLQDHEAVAVQLGPAAPVDEVGGADEVGHERVAGEIV